MEKSDGKLPELGLNSGPQALSQGHNHYTTQPHTHTHTHTHTKINNKIANSLAAASYHAVHLAEPDVCALSRHCEPCKQSSWSRARNSQENRTFLTASGMGT